MNILKSRLLAILLLVALLPTISAFGAEKVANNDMWLTCELSKPRFFSNEVVTATVWLHTQKRDLAYVKLRSAMKLNRDTVAFMTEVNGQQMPKQEMINDKVYYAYPVAVYALSVERAGKNRLQGMVLDVGVTEVHVVDDPWWGQRSVADNHEMTVNMKPVEFEVRPLPAVDAEFPFSGTVGRFEIETNLPKGDIIVNESALAYVTLKGTGYFKSNVLPEYREAFMKGAKLKSVSDNIEYYYTDNRLIAVKELECDFIPTDRKDCEIGAIKFGYFNPETEKYEMAESAPVKVNVKSSTTKREVISI